MKQKKIALAILALTMGIGAAYSLNKSFNHQPIYTANGTFIGCYYDGNVNCGQVITASNYYYVSDGIEVPVPANYQPKRVQ